MKALKKLIPAAAMLLLCAAMMTTATFAWFNMNESVAVDTGTTKVTAPTNLQIAKFDDSGAVGEYGNSVKFDSTNEINPATVKTGESTLVWETTNKATNDGVASGTLDTLTLDATGKDTTDGGYWKDKFFFNSYKMSLKNIGGTKIDVKLDDAVGKIAVTSTDTASGELYKAVCFMVIVDEVDSTAGSALPVVVWEDKTAATEATDDAPATVGGEMQTGKTLITGSAANGVIATLEAQKAATVTVIAWMEGNKKACANNKVASGTLSFALDFAFKAESAA